MKKVMTPSLSAAVIAVFAVLQGPLDGNAAEIQGEKAVIYAPEAGSPRRMPPIRLAARELKTHLDLITGAEVPILTNGVPPEGAYVLHVGVIPPGESADFKPEEGRWRVTATNAFFYGAEPTGPKMAVYAFLEDELGCRWVWGSNVAYRARNPIVVTNVAGGWSPQIRMRGIRTGNSCPDWRNRMRHGNHDSPQYGHAFTDYLKRGFLVTHPEYFAMRKDGRRLPPNVGADVDPADVAQVLADTTARFSMCVSSTGLVAQIVADWKQKGAPQYVNICENDATGANVCHCPACQALDDPPPESERVPWWPNWYADRYTYFANRVLEEARKVRPDAKACFYGYNATEQAPRREKAVDGLIVGLVPTYFDMPWIVDYVTRWKKAGFKDFFWRPNRHAYFDFRVIPGGCERHFFRIWQYVQSQNPIGYDYDCGSKSSRLQYFADYFLYKGMQDPTQSFEHWEDHYCEAFGAAAEDVKAYFRYWREAVWEKRLEPAIRSLPAAYGAGGSFNFSRALLLNLGTYYFAEDFAKAGEILDAAAQRRGLTAGDKARIAELRLAHEHAVVYFNALTRKCPENTLALYTFRKAHGFEIVLWDENYYGDLTGLREYIFDNHREDVTFGMRKWETRRLQGIAKPTEHEAKRLRFLLSTGDER